MKVRVFFTDEARFGQHGTLISRVGAQGLAAHRAMKTRYEWVYPYAAVDPGTGASLALEAPHVNTANFNTFLRVLGESLAPTRHRSLCRGYITHSKEASSV